MNSAQAAGRAPSVRRRTKKTQLTRTPLSHSKNGEITPKPGQNSSSEKKNDLPSLMELTSKSGNNDTDQAPECKKS